MDSYQKNTKFFGYISHFACICKKYYSHFGETVFHNNLKCLKEKLSFLPSNLNHFFYSQLTQFSQYMKLLLLEITHGHFFSKRLFFKVYSNRTIFDGFREILQKSTIYIRYKNRNYVFCENRHKSVKKHSINIQLMVLPATAVFKTLGCFESPDKLSSTPPFVQNTLKKQTLPTNKISIEILILNRLQTR